MAYNKLIIRIITCFHISRLIRFLIERENARKRRHDGGVKTANVSKIKFM